MSKQFYIKQFSLTYVSKLFHFKLFSCVKQFYFKQVSLAQVYSSVLFKPLDKALSDTTIPSQSRPGSNSNEGVLHIPQCPSITGTLTSDCLG